MSYNKEELLKLPLDEKLQLIEDLIASVHESEEEDESHLISIARERYEQYLKNPNDGISWEEARKLLWSKYGV